MEDNERDRWRSGIYLCTAKNSLDADILESKLRGENIPVEKKYKGASNFLEIFMGSNSAYPIDLYVPESTLEDAKNIIIAFPILTDEFPGEAIDFDSMTEEELAELIGEEDSEDK